MTHEVKLPPSAKLRRQARRDGGYEQVPAYTTDEVLSIIAAREAGSAAARRAAFRAGQLHALAIDFDGVLSDARREGDGRYTLRSSAQAFAKGAVFAVALVRGALVDSKRPVE